MREYIKRWMPAAVLIASAVLFAAAMILLVVSSLRRPEVPEYAPGARAAAPAGDTLIGPIVYTIDARSSDAWQFFRFADGAAVDEPAPPSWDLAVRRHQIIVNGGSAFAGTAGIADLGAVPFDAVRVVPQSGYLATRASSDSVVDGLGKWYDYGFLSHVLRTRGHVYAVRTAARRYAKLEILSYYCTGGAPGCLTIRYVYQPDGSRRVSR